MEFGVLGPVSAWSNGGELSLGGPRQRCVLGVLLVRLGHEVRQDQLVDWLWNDDPPRTARSIIQVQVSHLRKTLPTLIHTTPGGYRAESPPDTVDLHRFRGLASNAHATQDPDQAVLLWEAALRCWRGAPLSGVGSEALQYEIAHPLLEERWQARTGWAEAAFAAGHYSELVTALDSLIREDPLRERLRFLHAAALFELGDRGSALRSVSETRAVLDEHLGISPGRDLVRLQDRMARDQPRTSVAAPPPRRRPPNQLPRDIPDFTGRTETLSALRAAATTGSDTGPGAGPTVCVISGAGGSGKTVTALHAAHQLTTQASASDGQDTPPARFPDGALFLDLHGHTAGSPPMDTAAALARLLRGVGTPAAAVPSTSEERAALWRTVTCDLRLLLVLDNAATAEQIQPLLPTGPHSLTLVTSRNDLAEVAGARHFPLGRLGLTDSVRLLTAVVGVDRVERERDAVRRVVRHCAGLPLALRIVASRLATRPHWTFDHVERRLRDEPRRLGELRSVDHSMATVLELSVRDLSSAQAAAFTALGTMLGGCVDLRGASVLLDADPLDTDHLLQELVSVHLVEEIGVDLYRLHDLTWVYARHRAREALSDAERTRRRDRLANYYLAAAAAGSGWLGSAVATASRPPTNPEAPEWSHRGEVLEWFAAHRQNLAATIEHFAAAGSTRKAWQLAQALWRWYAYTGELHLWLHTHQRVLDIARADHDETGVAVTLTGLGVAHCYSGDLAKAADLLREAHMRFTSLGDELGQARALGNLGVAQERRGCFPDAVRAYSGVLDHARRLGDRDLEQHARVNSAVALAALGRYEEARDHCAHVLSDGTEGIIHAHALHVLGEMEIRTGDLRFAEGSLRRSLRVFRSWGDRLGEVEVRNSLAVLLRERGQLDDARAEHEAAVGLSERAAQPGSAAKLRLEWGVTLTRAERHTEAADVLREALDLARRRREQHIEGRTLLALGELPPPQVSASAAADHLRAAHGILTRLQVPEARLAQDRLSRVETPPQSPTDRSTI